MRIELRCTAFTLPHLGFSGFKMQRSVLCVQEFIRAVCSASVLRFLTKSVVSASRSSPEAALSNSKWALGLFSWGGDASHMHIAHSYVQILDIAGI